MCRSQFSPSAVWDTKGREHGAVSLRAAVQQLCLAYLLSMGRRPGFDPWPRKKLKPKKPTTKKQNKKGREEGKSNSDKVTDSELPDSDPFQFLDSDSVKLMMQTLIKGRRESCLV